MADNGKPEVVRPDSVSCLPTIRPEPRLSSSRTPLTGGIDLPFTETRFNAGLRFGRYNPCHRGGVRAVFVEHTALTRLPVVLKIRSARQVSP